MNRFKNIVLILFILLYGSAYSQKAHVAFDYTTVKAPIKMPTIKTPNFEKSKYFDIRDFGAVENDKHLNSKAISKAITEASQQSGRVIIPKGLWQTKAIHLKSNVNLHLEDGAVLLFSPDPADYLPAVATSWEGLECYNYSPLIYAFGEKNIAITGKGEIRAQMDIWKTWFSRPKAHMESIKNLYNWAQEYKPVEQRNMVNDTSNLRPHFIQFNRCENILIQDIKIRNSPFWTIHLYHSKDVIVRAVDIYAHGHNNDGVDPEMSQNILIEDCIFDQGDDAIAIKSGRNPEGWRLKRPSKNIVVRNCLIKNGHQLVAIGSELSGGIQNVYIENCKVADDNKKLMHLLFIKTNERMGGSVKNIFLQNIEANNIQEGILGIDTDVLYQWRTLVPTKIVKLTPIQNVFLENVQAQKGKFVVKINAHPDLPVKNISLKRTNLKETTQDPVQNKNATKFVWEK